MSEQNRHTLVDQSQREAKPAMHSLTDNIRGDRPETPKPGKGGFKNKNKPKKAGNAEGVTK